MVKVGASVRNTGSLELRRGKWREDDAAGTEYDMAVEDGFAIRIYV